MPNESRKHASASSKTAFHFLAGLGSGTFTAVLLQPADLLKTRLQQSTNTHVANPLVHAFRDVVSSPQGIRSLWRGTVPSAWRTGLGSALYFGSLNVMRSKLATAGIGTVPNSERSSSSLPKLSNTTNLLTGAVARASAGFMMMPITVIKVRYESSFYKYKSLLEASKDILRTTGFRGFFAGFGATAVRDAPYAGLYVLFYEESKRQLSSLSSAASASTSAGINFTSGILAAGTATALTNPFDAIKTRLQLMPQKYGNMLRAGRMMVQEGGMRSLFDGLGLRMARKAVSSALAWTVYEEMIRRAELRWVKAEAVE